MSSIVGCSTFFFSSRRRHTRFDCDWSSDVCSSDLFRPSYAAANRTVGAIRETSREGALGAELYKLPRRLATTHRPSPVLDVELTFSEIGRASCRERV